MTKRARPRPPRRPAKAQSARGAKAGRFGEYGGRYVAETLVPALEELEREFAKARKDKAFRARLDHYLRELGGRPTPLYLAERLTKRAGGARIWLKREDLVHGGAHKFNNVMGQALLAQRMGKRRLIAETGAGQHGVATAMAGAALGLDVEVFMGKVDVERQALNVFRMRLMGAQVHVVESGSQTLKDAINEALRDWVTNVEGTHYCLGSVVGPHPFPTIVREFQRVIGDEVRAQARRHFGRLPHALYACVGGGSNALGTFHPFEKDRAVELVGVEAAGDGLDTPRHSATLSAGRPGILHGALTYVLEDDDGQVAETHSVSAGLDYPGVGPEHSYLKDVGRVRYTSATDAEALEAVDVLCRTEGILPALESAHALAVAVKEAKRRKGQHVVVTLSGRGDKDVHTLAKAKGALL